MKEDIEEITYEKLEAFLEELASTTTKPIPLENSREAVLKTNIENGKKEIQQHRQQISTIKSRILTWEIELERLRRGC